VEWVDYREVDREGLVVEMGEGCLWVLIILCSGRGSKGEMVDLLYLIETIGDGVEMGIYLLEVHHLGLGSIRSDQRYVRKAISELGEIGQKLIEVWSVALRYRMDHRDLQEVRLDYLKVRSDLVEEGEEVEVESAAEEEVEVWEEGRYILISR